MTNGPSNGRWSRVRGAIRGRWGKLTDDELDGLEDRWDEIARLVQAVYGVGRDEARKQLIEYERLYHETRVRLERARSGVDDPDRPLASGSRVIIPREDEMKAIIGGLTLATIGVAACGPRADRSDLAVDTTAAAPAPDQTARVRVVQAVPGSETMDVRAGQQAAWEDLAFKAVSPYRPIEGLRTTLSIVRSNEPNAPALAENAEITFAGRYYTVIALPKEADGSGIELKTMKDEEPDDPAMARLRVINAAAGDQSFQIVTEADSSLIGGLGFKDDAAKDVQPGVYTLVVSLDGKPNTALLRLSDVDLPAGKSTTIVLVHPKAGSAKLEAVTIADEPSTVANADRR